jgi:hypothetical protein
MRVRIRAAILIGFAVAIGHLAWGVRFAPIAPYDPVVAGEFTALMHPDPDTRHLYLRRTFHFTQRPQSAWLRIVARDRVRLIVNGRWIETQTLDGFDVAITADIAPHLNLGKNVVAIVADQTRLRGRPAIAIEGAYTLSESEHPITSETGWYCNRSFERTGDVWFGPDFDERRWPVPEQRIERFHARTPLPPDAVTTPDRGRWIGAPSMASQIQAFRSDFPFEGRPASAWIRVTSTTPYRFAINGTVIDQQAAGLGLQQPLAPVRRTYDVTPHVRNGTNTIAFLSTASGVPPRLLVDGVVSDGCATNTVIASGAGWSSRSGEGTTWLDAESAGWQPCRVEGGNGGLPPWGPGRQDIAAAEPWTISLGWILGQLAVMVFIGFVAWFGCRYVGSASAELALVLPAIATAAGALATFDPRFTRQDYYREGWLILALAAVPLQWFLLARFKTIPIPRPPKWLSRRNTAVALLAAALCVGIGLRVRDIKSEPLQWDEVENYNATIATLKYGFPMLEVHEDLPRLVIHTSEFQFVFHAAVAAVTSDPQYVVRLPAVVFSSWTILLVFAVGRRMFGWPAGLAAAWLYALSSGYAPMATVGRYFGQLQFFTLLTVYTGWRLAERPAPLEGKWIWAAAFSFLAMFFTWEGSALAAPAIGAAMVFTYRGSLRGVAFHRTVWMAAGLIVLAYMLQRAHHSFAQTRFLWIGISLSDVRLLPMWNHQSFQPWYYLWESSWSQDALLPALGLAGALLAAAGKGGRPFRFLLWIYVPTCLAMAFLLPNYQFRYIYHVSPLLILLASAALCRFAIALTRLTPPRPPAIRFHARCVAATTVLAALALGCGQVLDTRYLTRMRVDGVTTGLFKYPDLGGPSRYVRDRMQPGDIVISNNVFQTNHLMGIMGQSGQPNNYIPMTGRLFLPATFPDHASVLIDRRDGVRVIASPEDFKELVARHPRIWYIVQPGQHYTQNAPTVSDYVNDHFEVVYEDYDALVLFHGGHNSPAAIRQKRQKESMGAGIRPID